MEKEDTIKRWCDSILDTAIRRPHLLTPQRAIDILKGAARMADFLGNPAARSYIFRTMIDVHKLRKSRPNVVPFKQS